MAETTPQDKVLTCLNYIDNRLENTAEQTIQIAEMMIQDIRELSGLHTEAIESDNLVEHLNRMRDTQIKWMNQLQDIILEQANRDLSGQVILALKQFNQGITELSLAKFDFELPSAVAAANKDDKEYISQDDIDKMFD